MKGLSAELLEQVPKLKKGQRVVFELLGIRYDPATKKHIIPTSKAVPNTDRIFDPGKDEFVDISFVRSERPSGPNSARETTIELGQILFTREESGRIVIVGGDRKKEELYEYLCLSNFNASNAGKDYFIKPNSGFIFKQLTPAKTAKEELMKEREIRAAGDAIDKMAANKLRDIAKGMELPAVDEHTDLDSLRMMLYRIAKNNPVRILKLDEDVSIGLISLIKDATAAGIIEKDISNNIWKWSDGGDKICVIVPGKTPEHSLKDYLVSGKGDAVLNVIESQLKPRKAKKG